MSGPRRVGVLHVVTDETRQDRFSHVELARLAAQGGADVVQLREKRPRTTRELVRLARAVAEALAPSPARLVIDDRVDVALAAGVAAVHLGPEDLDAELARRLLGPEALIGRTANDLEEALAAAELPVDYLGVGPVFGTESKSNPASTLGLDTLRETTRRVRKPVIAIGNITPQRLPDVLAAGAHGVAVLSAIACSRDPLAATAEFRRRIDECLHRPAGS